MAVKTKEQLFEAAKKISPEYLLGEFGGRKNERAFDLDEEMSSTGLTKAQYAAYLANADNDPLARAALGESAPGVKEKILREKERTENRRAYENLLLDKLKEQDKLINDRILDLNKTAELLRAKIAEDQAFIDGNNLWIDEMHKRHSEAASGIAYFIEHGHLERDENGEIKNKAARQLLDDYIERQRKEGKKIEYPEHDAVAVKYMRDQQEWELSHAKDLGKANTLAGDEIVKTKVILRDVNKEAQDLKEGREEIDRKFKTPAERLEAATKLWQGADKDVLIKARELCANNREYLKEIEHAGDSSREDIEQQAGAELEEEDLSMEAPSRLQSAWQNKGQEPEAPAERIAQNLDENKNNNNNLNRQI